MYILKREFVLKKIYFYLYFETALDLILVLTRYVGNLIVRFGPTEKKNPKNSSHINWGKKIDFFSLTWLVTTCLGLCIRKKNKVLNYLVRQINFVVTYRLLLTSLNTFMSYLRNYLV